MNPANCQHLPLIPLNAVWYRAIAPRYWSRLHYTAYTKVVTSRFNPGAHSPSRFEILYLGEDPIVTLYEVEALYGSPSSPIPNPSDAWCIVNLDVILDNVADLTDVANLQLLQTTGQELTGNWRQYQPPGTAPTQLLGVALFNTPGVQGFLTTSARQPPRRNLVVFPEKVQGRSRILVTDSATGRTYQVGSIPP